MAEAGLRNDGGRGIFSAEHEQCRDNVARVACYRPLMVRLAAR